MTFNYESAYHDNDPAPDVYGYAPPPFSQSPDPSAIDHHQMQQQRASIHQLFKSATIGSKAQDSTSTTTALNNSKTSKFSQPAVRPRIFLMGTSGSGKTSIAKVVFRRLSPTESSLLHPTKTIEKDIISNSPFMQFELWDFPGSINIIDILINQSPPSSTSSTPASSTNNIPAPSSNNQKAPYIDPKSIFGGEGALIFVLNCQTNYTAALGRLHKTVAFIHKINPKLKFSVFIHKTDGLPPEQKTHIIGDLLRQANAGLPNGGKTIPLNFYPTSIFDHSIYEAFPKVIQQLLPQVSVLEDVLTTFISSSAVEKAILFDVSSKIYIASSDSSIDPSTLEIASDLVDLVLDVSDIYEQDDEDSSTADSKVSALYLPPPSSESSASQMFSSSTSSESNNDDESIRATVHLNTKVVLYMRQMVPQIALICLMRKESFARRGLIDYNLDVVKEKIEVLCKTFHREY